jgi:mannose-6-phosphate isomerase-like protein (cupin superfamily)
MFRGELKGKGGKMTKADTSITDTGSVVNLDRMLARFTEHWSPKTIAQINDYEVRIVKVQGEFTWHRHADTDEFFLVLRGQLTIQMRDRNVVLGPQELFVVPRGVEHCPRADTETQVLLFEPSSVVNTGDAGGELTAEFDRLP